jgi:hypothetical protein
MADHPNLIARGTRAESLRPDTYIPLLDQLSIDYGSLSMNLGVKPDSNGNRIGGDSYFSL